MPHSVWTILRESFTSSRFYLGTPRLPWSTTLKTILVSSFLLSLLATADYVVHRIPQVESDLEQTQTEVVDHYPEDLQIAWDGSTLQMNRDLVELQYPKDFDPDEYGLPDQLGFISNAELDEQTIISTHDPSPLIVITPSQLFVQENPDNYSPVKLENLIGSTRFDVTKETVAGQLGNLRQTVVSFLTGSAVIAPLLFTPLLFAKILLTGLLESIIVYFVMKLSGILLTWKESYQFAVHLLIPVEFIHQSLRLLSGSTVTLSGFSFWLLLLVIIWSTRPKVESYDE